MEQICRSVIDLNQVKKIESEIGMKMTEEELPLGLIVEGDRKKKKPKEDDLSELGNGAFHEKKAKNAKEVNLNSKDKIKLYGKVRKKGRS